MNNFLFILQTSCSPSFNTLELLSQVSIESLREYREFILVLNLHIDLYIILKDILYIIRTQ